MVAEAIINKNSKNKINITELILIIIEILIIILMILYIIYLIRKCIYSKSKDKDLSISSLDPKNQNEFNTHLNQ